MRGLMMDYPLTVTGILERVRRVFPEKRVISRRHDGSVCTHTYGEVYRRSCRLANALRAAGVKPGDRVASFAWNSHRHLELYYAVPAIGAVLHTLNARLSAAELTYIVNHAEDKIIFVDRSLASILAAMTPSFRTVERYVIMDDLGEAPDFWLNPSVDYEAFIGAQPDTARFPKLDENTAAGLCYTSGTTGNPKGVLYSHRSFYLHAMGACMADSVGVSERDVVMPVVPMFHANAWGLPYTCGLAGADLVMPGSSLAARPLAELIQSERVTLPAGVPTIWTLLLQYLRQHPHDLSSVRATVVGGAPAPRALIEAYEKELGLPFLHAWGMTELSPIGLVCRPKRSMDEWPDGKLYPLKAKQGLPVAGVEARIMGADGQELPCDGEHVGELEVRGPWVAGRYYAEEAPSDAFTDDGWFRTGDVVTIDSLGYVEITDRRKDVIKSRGEWISSVDMENTVMGLPGVFEAAVVGRPDELRGEAPVVLVALLPKYEPAVTPRDVVNKIATRFIRWQVPKLMDVHIVESIPKTSVGKFDKKAIRAKLKSGEV